MKKLLVLFLIVAMPGCSRLVEEPEKIWLRSYVMEYYDSDEIALEAVPKGTVYFPDNKSISVGLVAKGMIGSYKDREGSTAKAAYDALCIKHGDMTFNRTIKVHIGVSVIYPGVDFTAIEVTSNSDFDVSHLAGQPLNDIMTFYYRSAKPYIDSGYTEYDETLDNVLRTIKYSVITKKLDEVTAADLILLGAEGIGSVRIGYIGSLIFDSEPTLSKTHKFTVTMTADDGRTFAASVDMTFE